MQSHLKLTVIILAGLASVVFAREAATSPERPVPARSAIAAGTPSFPYTAEVIGDDVNIRSGPGTDYYTCGKLSKGDMVEVVNKQFSWSRIVPPAGSFSWISMQYVSKDPDNPNIGIVTGDIVRAWAGSDTLEPVRSETLQLKLNRGHKVKLLGENKDDYYKIAPPDGAYLWVSTQFIKPFVKAAVVKTVEDANDVEPKEVDPNKTTVVVEPNDSVEEEMLKKYRALEKTLRAERAKPIDKQDYTSIKKALTEIANNKEAGGAARNSKFVLKQIGRLELILVICKQSQLQDTELQKTQTRIDKARTARLEALKKLGRFAVIGQFKSSNIYGPEAELKHYRIVDKSYKTICYALPSDETAKTDLSKLIGKKVGLVGKIESHPATGGALVRFTEIIELKE